MYEVIKIKAISFHYCVIIHPVKSTWFSCSLIKYDDIKLYDSIELHVHFTTSNKHITANQRLAVTLACEVSTGQRWRNRGTMDSHIASLGQDFEYSFHS